MHNDLITIGGFTIHGYGLMIALGFLSAIYISYIRAGKINLDKEKIYDFAICAILGGIFGAKMLYVLTNIGAIKDNPDLLLNFADGFVVYGGILGGFICCAVYAYARGLKFFDYFDLIMPQVFIGQGFGRIGCFLAGCCYGEHYSGPGAITFTGSTLAPNGVALFPTQIVSSVFDFSMGLLLIYISNKHKKFDGQIAALYLIIYSVGRTIIEFFRGDTERGFILSLSTSQFISIFILLAGIILYFVQRKKCKN